MLKQQKAANWKLAFVLSAPWFLFYVSYFFYHAPELEPTGFIQYDNISYAANARQYIENHFSQWEYANALSDRGREPIYFQPQILVLALMIKAGLAPGIALCLFSLLFIVLGFYLLIGLVQQFVDDAGNRKIAIWIWAWGGGLLYFSGLLLSYAGVEKAARDPFFLDPASGWWGLNWGRSLLFSLESYYHFLFLAALLSLVKARYWQTLCVAALLAISHPFTGLELILVLFCWSLAEKWIFRNRQLPLYFLGAVLLLLLADTWYYLQYLPSFPEHRQVFRQYSLNWRLRYFHMLPAWCFVMGLTLYGFYKTGWRSLVARSANRVAVSLLLVSLVLANHDLFTSARQPIHFSRGYVYTGFMLCGMVGLGALLKQPWLNRNKWILLPLLFLVFSDNLFWVGRHIADYPKVPSVSYISRDQKTILQWMEAHADTSILLVASDDILPYLATAFTNAYAYTPHVYTTPFYGKKKKAFDGFYCNGQLPADWNNRMVWWLIDKTRTSDDDAFERNQEQCEVIFENRQYRIVRVHQEKSAETAR